MIKLRQIMSIALISIVSSLSFAGTEAVLSVNSKNGKSINYENSTAKINDIKDQMHELKKQMKDKRDNVKKEIQVHKQGIQDKKANLKVEMTKHREQMQELKKKMDAFRDSK